LATFVGLPPGAGAVEWDSDVATAPQGGCRCRHVRGRRQRPGPCRERAVV